MVQNKITNFHLFRHINLIVCKNQIIKNSYQFNCWATKQWLNFFTRQIYFILSNLSYTLEDLNIILTDSWIFHISSVLFYKTLQMWLHFLQMFRAINFYMYHHNSHDQDIYCWVHLYFLYVRNNFLHKIYKELWHLKVLDF